VGPYEWSGTPDPRGYGGALPQRCLPSASELYTTPKLSHVDFSLSQSAPFHKALDIEQNAKCGQKKLALNMINKSLSRVNIFSSTGMGTIQPVNFSRTN